MYPNFLFFAFEIKKMKNNNGSFDLIFMKYVDTNKVKLIINIKNI